MEAKQKHKSWTK